MLAPPTVRSGRSVRRMSRSFAPLTPLRLAPALLVSVAALTLGGCVNALLGAGGDGPTAELLSPIPALVPSDNPITVDNLRFETRETRLGAKQHPQILKTFGGVYSNPKVERAVARIVGRLTAASPESNETYRVTLLDSPSVNAFALPGGYLYVTRGLLALADDSAELAAVLAHEMAHVTADHGIERQRRVASASVKERVASRVMTDGKARIALARDELDAASFSRAQELEADDIGTRTMARAGFDPSAAVDFLKAMERYTAYRSAGRSDGSLDFLATHPAAPQRMAKLKTLVAALGSGGARERDRYLDGIDGIAFGDGVSDGFVRGRSFLHPELGIAFEVPEGYTLRNESDAVIATGPNDVASRFDTVPATGGAPDAYIRSGWVAGLAESTVEAFELNDRPAARARAFAGGYAFDVVVIEAEGRFFRFLTAAPPTVGNLASRADSIARTFRVLSKPERDALQPLRLVVREGAGPDAMSGVERPEALFTLLNPGRDGRMKVVTDR